MILKTSQRGGARQLVNHLLNTRNNEHIDVYEIKGFFSDNLHDALQEAEKLRERGVNFQIVTLDVDTTTPFGELLYTVMAAFAQFERRNLITRTKEGMEAARRRGKRLGRPPLFDDQDLRKAHAKIVSGETTVNALVLELGCCRDTLPKAFKRIGLNA